MNNQAWKSFFSIASRILGKGSFSSLHSESWCSFSTYQRLGNDAGYYCRGLPSPDELENEGLADGGTWGQPFRYSDIAHLIVPRQFVQTGGEGKAAVWRHKEQDIAALSRALNEAGIPHVLSEWALEIRCIAPA